MHQDPFLADLEKRQDQVLKRLQGLLDQWQGDFASRWKATILEVVERGFREMRYEFDLQRCMHTDAELLEKWGRPNWVSVWASRALGEMQIHPLTDPESPKDPSAFKLTCYGGKPWGRFGGRGLMAWLAERGFGIGRYAAKISEDGAVVIKVKARLET